MNLHGFVGVERVDLRFGRIRVFDRLGVGIDSSSVGVEILLEGGEIVGARRVHGARVHLNGAHRVRFFFALGLGVRESRFHRDPRFLDAERVVRESVFLGFGDVAVDAVRERENRGDTDDADRARERGHDRAALFRHKVVEAEHECRERPHARVARGLRFARLLEGRVEGIGITYDVAVGKLDDAGCVFVGELGVVSDHDDEAIARDLAKKVHDLHGRGGVEGTRGLVGEKNLGVVDESACNSYSLHLPAGKLARFLVHMFAKAHFGERIEGAFAALGSPDARERESELNVRKDTLVGDEVVALENETDAVVAVAIPVAVPEVFRRDTVDDEVAGIEVIEAANHVEHRGFAGSGLAEDRDELVVTKRDAHAGKRDLGKGARRVGLGDVVQFEHGSPWLLARRGSFPHPTAGHV